MSEIWAIILAGGESKRMGTPKMLLPYRGATIIETVIQNIASSSVEKTLVVLGSDSDRILQVISGYPVIHCYNDAYKSGMLSSVKMRIRRICLMNTSLRSYFRETSP